MSGSGRNRHAIVGVVEIVPTCEKTTDELCALGAEEQDSGKLLALTREIDRFLAEKEQWFRQSSPKILPRQLFPRKIRRSLPH